MKTDAYTRISCRGAGHIAGYSSIWRCLRQVRAGSLFAARQEVTTVRRDENATVVNLPEALDPVIEMSLISSGAPENASVNAPEKVES